MCSDEPEMAMISSNSLNHKYADFIPSVGKSELLFIGAGMGASVRPCSVSSVAVPCPSSQRKVSTPKGMPLMVLLPHLLTYLIVNYLCLIN